MKVKDDRQIDYREQPEDYVRAVIESRVFYRRRLAQKITVTLVRAHIEKGQSLNAYYSNVAQFVEDLANAVTERLAAREDAELKEQL